VDVAADIAALAAILDGERRYDESEPLYQRALCLARNYEIAINSNNLAAVYHETGRLTEDEWIIGLS
jgi:hypothetical protein